MDPENPFQELGSTVQCKLNLDGIFLHFLAMFDDFFQVISFQ